MFGTNPMPGWLTGEEEQPTPLDPRKQDQLMAAMVENSQPQEGDDTTLPGPMDKMKAFGKQMLEEGIAPGPGPSDDWDTAPRDHDYGGATGWERMGKVPKSKGFQEINDRARKLITGGFF